MKSSGGGKYVPPSKRGGNAASPNAASSSSSSPSFAPQQHPVSYAPPRQTGSVEFSRDAMGATDVVSNNDGVFAPPAGGWGSSNMYHHSSSSSASYPSFRDASASGSSMREDFNPRQQAQSQPSYHHDNHHHNNHKNTFTPNRGGASFSRGGGGFVGRGGGGGGGAFVNRGGGRGGGGGGGFDNNHSIADLKPKHVSKEHKLHLKMLLKGAYDEEDFESQHQSICTALAACANGDDEDEIRSVFEVLAEDNNISFMLRNWAITSKSIVIFDLADRMKYGNLLLENDKLCELVLTVLGKCLDSAADNHALRTSIDTLRGWISSGKCTVLVDELWKRVVEVANRADAPELGRRRQGHLNGGDDAAASTTHHRVDDGKLVMYQLDVFPDLLELLEVVDKRDAISQLYPVDTAPFSSLKVHFDTQYQLLRADFALNFCHGFQLAYNKLRNPHRGQYERNMSARVYTEVVLAPSAFSLDRFKGITFTFIVDWRQFGPSFNRVNAKKRFMDGNLIVVSPNFTSESPELHMGVVVNISEKDRTFMKLSPHQVPFRVSFNKPFFKFVEGSVDYKFTVVESSDFFLATHAVLNVLKTSDPSEVPLPIVEALRGVKTTVPAYIAANPFLSVNSAISVDPTKEQFSRAKMKSLTGAECDKLFADLNRNIDALDTDDGVADADKAMWAVMGLAYSRDSALLHFVQEVLTPWMTVFKKSQDRRQCKKEIACIQKDLSDLGVDTSSGPDVALTTGIPAAIAALDAPTPTTIAQLKLDLERHRFVVARGSFGGQSEAVLTTKLDRAVTALDTVQKINTQGAKLVETKKQFDVLRKWFAINKVERLASTKMAKVPPWDAKGVDTKLHPSVFLPYAEIWWAWYHYNDPQAATSYLLDDNADVGQLSGDDDSTTDGTPTHHHQTVTDTKDDADLTNITTHPARHVKRAQRLLSVLVGVDAPDDVATAFHAARILGSFELQNKLHTYKSVRSHIDVREANFWNRLSSWTPQLEATLNAKDSNAKVQALDHTQVAGMRNIFNNNIAIVQGTPGTGKTFIGAKFVQLLLDNDVKCGPIVVMCFSNHALDSFMHSLIPLTANPEQDIVRLGSSSKDEEMKKYALLNRLRNLPWDQRIRALGDAVQRISDFNDPHKSESCIKQIFKCQDPALQTFRAVLLPWITRYKYSSTLQHVNNEIAEAKNYLEENEVYVEEGENGEVTLEGVDDAIRYYKKCIAETEEYLTQQQRVLITLRTRIGKAEASVAPVRENPNTTNNTNNQGKKKNKKKSGKNGGGGGGGRTLSPEAIAKLIKDLKTEEQCVVADKQGWMDDSKYNADCIVRIRRLKESLPDTFLDKLELEEWFESQNVQPLPNVEGRDWGGDTAYIYDDSDADWWLTWLKYGGALGPNATSHLLSASPLNTVVSQNEADCGDNIHASDDDDDGNNDEARQVEDQLAGEAAAAREVDDEGDEGESAAELHGVMAAVNVTDIPDNLLALARDYLSSPRLEGTADDFATALHAAQILASYELKSKLKDLCVEVDKSRAELLHADARQKADVMRKCKIVGATTIGAVRDLQALRLLKPKVVIVEECAEVLESHILASLTSNIQHLILIGDHLQLKPKVSDFGIEKKGLGMSLMERLVLTKKIPFVTLHQQRRMHPDISELTKNYYRRKVQVEIEDHPSVHVNRAPVGGVDSALRVAWIDTSAMGAVEAMHPGMQSPFNSKEAELSLCIAEYLMHQEGLSPSQITILVPYTGQLMEVMGKARQINLPQGPNGVRIVTIDNFQGEENDVIIVSLTRTSGLGFLDIENRACVCLSRARRGMFILGDVGLLEKSRNKLWTDALQGCRSRGHVFTAMPGACETHNTPITFHNTYQLRGAIGPNFGCKSICGSTQVCGHPCRQMCHSTPCDRSSCREDCCRIGSTCNPPRTCDHPCNKKCTATCGLCEILVDRVLLCDHQMRLPCHINPDEHKCMKDITRTNSEGCGHLITAACWMWSSDDQDSISALCKSDCRGTHSACGHTCPEKCHYPNPCPPCVVEKTKKYIQCGHSDVVPCSKPLPPCTVPIEVELSCGHMMQRPCNPNLAETVIAQHQCPAPITKSLDRFCNHLVEAPCWQWTGDRQEDMVESCDHKCGLIMPCGHQCESVCHVATSTAHPPCTYQIVTALPCGHLGNKACGSSRTPMCTVVCGQLLACGHPCNLVCHPPSTPHEKCMVLTNLHLPCTHVLESVPCHLQYDLEKAKRLCKESCTFIHTCGHTCSGSCGACRGSFHYLDHEKCRESCGRILPLCGHRCKGGCTKDCPSCTEVCGNRCTHSDCSTLGKKTGRHYCGACSAPECKMPCEWVCPHKSCTKTCHEECDRDACIERCTKQLTCGHQCCGLCGEECPVFCTDCFHSKVDVTEDERNVELQHFTLLGTLPHTETAETLQSYLTSGNARASLDVIDSTIHTLQCGCTLFVSELLSYVESHVTQTKLSALLCPTLACRKSMAPSDFRIARTHVLRHKIALSAAQIARSEARNDRVVSVRDAFSSLQSQLESLLKTGGGAASSASTLSWLLNPPQEPSEPKQPPPPRNFSKFPPKPQEKADHKKYQELQQKNKQPVVGLKEWLSRNDTVDRNIYMKKMEEFHRRKAQYDDELERYDSQKESLLRSLERQLGGGVPTYILEDVLDNIIRASELKEQGDSCTSQDTELIDALARRSGLLVDVMHHQSRLRRFESTTALFTPVYDICDDDVDDDAKVCARQIQKIIRGWIAARASVVLTVCQSHGHDATNFDNNQFGQLMRAGQQFLGTNWKNIGNAQIPPVVINNRCNESSCVAYTRFMRGIEHARRQLHAVGAGVSGQDFMGVNVRFGFHGTSPEGIPGICCGGFDVSRRAGQVYGPGEYFAESPSMSAQYARNEAQMLLCVIIDGPWMTLPNNGMIVVNNPVATPDIAFCLPIGVLVYNDLDTCIEFSKGCRSKPRISKVMVDNLSREWEDLNVPWNVSDISKKIADAEDALGLPKPQYTFSQNATTAVDAANLPEGGQNYYRCPQGHVFSVGDCGSVLEGTRCPVCGVEIELLY